MIAIVVRQPWATLIALGVKSIETRPSPPNGPMRPEGVRGLPGCSVERGARIAIVAGSSVPPRGDCCGDWSVESWRDGFCGPCAVHLGAPSLTNGFRSPVDLPLGAVVCTVTVDDALLVVDSEGWDSGLADTNGGIVRFLEQPYLMHVSPLGEEPVGGHYDDQLPLGDFTPGRWGWLLGEVRQTTPIPCKGRQGVFTLPDDVAAQIEAQS